MRSQNRTHRRLLVKAITLIQPWASLIVDLRKPWETRSWYTTHRGPVAIHAGAKVDREACENFGYDPATIPTRAVLGIANLVRCVQFLHPDVQPDPYGDYCPGRFGFEMREVKKFAVPISAKGALGFWEWQVPQGLTRTEGIALVEAQPGLFVLPKPQQQTINVGATRRVVPSNADCSAHLQVGIPGEANR